MQDTKTVFKTEPAIKSVRTEQTRTVAVVTAALDLVAPYQPWTSPESTLQIAEVPVLTGDIC